ncbi:MAG TPA: ArsB/NhaD family transporter [Anaerovoracaceae bacterium]|nr:ArsB/NhaD family transporter [Anaerovoracaceae bacterium]
MAESTYFTISIIIFVAVYALIIWDKFDRAVVALSGAMLMVLLRVLNQDEAFAAIDYNTIGLLVAMMIIVMIMRRTGIFEYLGIKMVKASKADPFWLLILLCLTTGVLSALLDNVTTILLILPITLSVTASLKLNPIPYIIAAIFASNVGGTATLIGDPPNIMIGSQTGLNFVDFLINDAVIALPMLIFTSFLFAFIYKKSLVTTPELKAKVMALDEKSTIKDSQLLNKCMVVFVLVIVGFLFHGVLHFESSTIALTGAVILLFVSGIDSEHVLIEVEWKTIFFFSGLFILVGGIEETGVISMLAEKVIELTGGDLFLTAIAILWVSAIASAFIDNIPFVATMIPLILQMGEMTDMNIMPLWWALSLGACLGGNGTAIGASANVVAIGIAEREGYRITFGHYFKIAFPVMLITIAISTVYILFKYLI